jgi:ferredoxin
MTCSQRIGGDLQASKAGSRNLNRWILPVAVLGRSTMKNISRGNASPSDLDLQDRRRRAHAARRRRHASRAPIEVLKQHLIDPEICIRCNTCEETCPVDAVTHDSNNYVVKVEACNGCMACISPCPTGSIDNWRTVLRTQAYSIEELFVRREEGR